MAASSDAIFSAGAVDLRRYLVPDHAVCTVQYGLSMRVDEDFAVDGELVLIGELKVMES